MIKAIVDSIKKQFRSLLYATQQLLFIYEYLALQGRHKDLYVQRTIEAM